MLRIPHRLWLWFLLLTLALTLTVWVGFAQGPARIDDSALRNAGKTGEEWISYNGDWAETRFSRLRQIDDSNVSRLGMAWTFDIPNVGAGTRQTATPLVSNGVLYSITPWSVVYAVDARTGKEIWRNDPTVNQQIWQSRICCGVVNRGIALYEGKVIAPVIDGRLRALDASTGKVLWETRVSPSNMPYTITMAPRVIKGGKVIIGAAGGEYAVRGFFDAYDAATGERTWRFYTVPGDPSKPFEHEGLAQAAKTWSGEWWKLGGGGNVWGGVSYDPDEDLVYVATGSPGPWSELARGPGDNLYTDSIIAVRGATGKYVWHYQEIPGDDWDLDSIADMTLANLTIDGRLRKVLLHAPKNGFFYVLDRVSGELLSADPWVTLNWAAGVDLQTGRPLVNPGARYGTTGVNVMPGPSGGHTWPPMSFNPDTGLVYIPGTIGSGYSYAANPNFVPSPTDIGDTGRGALNLGTGTAGAAARGAQPPATALAPALDGGPPIPGLGPRGTVAGPPSTAAARGSAATLPSIGPQGRGNILIAWNPVLKKEQWRGPAGSGAGFNAGGTLTTAGNLVFTHVNGALQVYRADNGMQVANLATGASPGPPMTFLLDGRQYVVAAAATQGAAARGGTAAARLFAFTLDGPTGAPAPFSPAAGRPGTLFVPSIP